MFNKIILIKVHNSQVLFSGLETVMKLQSINACIAQLDLNIDSKLSMLGAGLLLVDCITWI